jgi:uncharacterized protein
MPTVDSDAHVIETEGTWEYMQGADARYRPAGIKAPDASGAEKEYWLIDGRLFPRRSNIGKDTSEATREMIDIAGRLKHMDELEVDLHVLYPTLFLRPVSDKPEVELALYRSYNRWLGDIWQRGSGRLLWAAMAPVMTMDAAIEELRWAKEHGAVAVFMRGVEHDRRLSDPSFFPLYQAASDLNLAIGIHSGNGNFDIHDFYADEVGFAKFKLAVLGGFHSLLMAEVPKRFPKLRIGVIEISAQWVPYALHDLAARLKRVGKPFDMYSALRENRIWVACQTDDDLPYVLKYAGEDNIVIGSDYGHADTSSELEALRTLRHGGEVPGAVIDKILDANARVLYGLS